MGRAKSTPFNFHPTCWKLTKINRAHFSNSTAFAKAPNELKQIEHNMSSRLVADHYCGDDLVLLLLPMQIMLCQSVVRLLRNTVFGAPNCRAYSLRFVMRFWTTTVAVTGVQTTNSYGWVSSVMDAQRWNP